MRSELQLLCGHSELLENFAGVAMSENGVRRKTLGNFDEMRLRSRCFARTGDSGLGVANYAVMDIHEAGLDPRRECENDRRRIATRVRHQACACDRLSVQFGYSIN